MGESYSKRARKAFLQLRSVDMLDDLLDYLKDERESRVKALSKSTDQVVTNQLQGRVQELDDLIDLASDPQVRATTTNRPPVRQWPT